MNDLAKHIEILLLDNDCVIVPGFGGFMAHHVDSVYVDVENSFLPPSRTLGFNPKLRLNDSLLVQSYIETYDISYPEALKRIEDDVREVKQTLNNEGKYELVDIGELTVNEDGNYEYISCMSGILTPDLYALSSFEMPLLSSRTVSLPVDTFAEKSQDDVVENKEEIEDNPRDTIESGENFDAEFHDDEEGQEEDSVKIVKIDLSKLRKIAAAAILLLLFVFASVPVGDGSMTGQQLCSIDTSILSSIKGQSHSSSSSLGDLLLKDNSGKNSIKENPVDSMKTSKGDNSDERVCNLESQHSLAESFFVVVLASKVATLNAECFVDRLKANGISDARRLPTGETNKVVCGSFHSQCDANERARQLRNMSSEYADAWVMKVGN